MIDYSDIKQSIATNLPDNNNKEITAAKLRSTLNEFVDKVETTETGMETEINAKIARLENAGYLFAGVATKDTNPSTPDTKVFYIADGKGVYTNFGGISVTEDEVVVLYYDTAWHKEATGIASNDKLTELDQKVEINKRTLDLNISDSNPYIIENYQYIEGLIPEDSTILSNPNWISYYIPVTKGEAIRITVNTSGARTGYTNDIPKLMGDFQGYINHPTSGAANNTVFESPINGYFVVGLVNTATIQFYKENNGIGNRVKRVEENTSILSEELSRLDNKTEKISRDLYSNLSDDGNYVIQAKTIDGLIPQTSSILGNSAFTLYYIKVFKGEVIDGKVISDAAIYTCFTESIHK